eukprot:4578161-Pyramimonas_sp.AAC.1
MTERYEVLYIKTQFKEKFERAWKTVKVEKVLGSDTSTGERDGAASSGEKNAGHGDQEATGAGASTKRGNPDSAARPPATGKSTKRVRKDTTPDADATPGDEDAEKKELAANLAKAKQLKAKMMATSASATDLLDIVRKHTSWSWANNPVTLKEITDAQAE